MISRILFSKFGDVFPAFTCARAICNHWSICLGVDTLRFERSETLATWAGTPGLTAPSFGYNVNIPLLKTLSVISLPS